MFLGNLTFGIDGGGRLTLTRANGSDLGSFIDEGFAPGQFIQVNGPDAGHSGQFHILTVTDTMITLLETLPAWSSVTTTNESATISRLTPVRQVRGQGRRRDRRTPHRDARPSRRRAAGWSCSRPTARA